MKKQEEEKMLKEKDRQKLEYERQTLEQDKHRLEQDKQWLERAIPPGVLREMENTRRNARPVA